MADAGRLVDLSLEQLSNIVVTSVSRREESLANAPASVYVITHDDIRRSGVTSLPEALRLAPNLQVARADTNQYAISARGFNNVLANKLLVMIDGRTVYTPLFSGTFWEAQDVLLEDIDRIEVISGPGATLWGANAVNGVINILTRDARDTQGALAAGGGGNLEYGGAARYGGSLGNGAYYRAYGKSMHRDNSELANGDPIRDASTRTQGGFRVDWDRDAHELTLQGDAYTGDIDQAPASRTIQGANVLGRWSARFADGSLARVQAYYDYTYRNHPGTFRETLSTFDLEAQYGTRIGDVHELVAGAGYRIARDDVTNSAQQALLPAYRTLAWGNVYAQDQIALAGNVDLIVGAKVETNVYTDAEFLPNIRIAWRPAAKHMVWAAASRAIRSPARIDRDFYAPGRPPYVIAGNETFESETANVYEIGYRGQFTSSASLTLTAFASDYDRLRSLRPQPGGAVFGNGIEGTSTGIEAWGTWRVLPNWQLFGGVDGAARALAGEAGQRRHRGLLAARQRPFRAVERTLVMGRDARHRLRPHGAAHCRAAGPGGAGVHRGRRAAGVAADARARGLADRPESVRSAARRVGAGHQPRGDPAQLLPRFPVDAALMRARRALGRLLWACWYLAVAASPLVAQTTRPGAAPAEPSLERVVKAVFLYKFLDYAEWPAAALADASAPYVIGVYGADDIARELAQIASGHTANGRAVDVRRVRRGDSLAGLHMLFVGAGESAQMPALVRAVQGMPVLVVAEDERGLAGGNAINLVVVDGKVRFDVALDAAERAGVRLSSRLLAVARSVRTGRSS